MGNQLAPRTLLLLAVLFVAIIALPFAFQKSEEGPDSLAKLKAQYQNVELTESTFQGYQSKKASAVTPEGKILVQVVHNVPQDGLAEIISQLNSPITRMQEPFAYFDPYKGKTVEYALPEELRPLAKEARLEENLLPYHVVYANEIFSYFVFSKEEAAFQGIVATFSCGKDVYKVELFSQLDSFDEKNSLAQLADLYCP